MTSYARSWFFIGLWFRLGLFGFIGFFSFIWFIWQRFRCWPSSSLLFNFACSSFTSSPRRHSPSPRCHSVSPCHGSISPPPHRAWSPTPSWKEKEEMILDRSPPPTSGHGWDRYIPNTIIVTIAVNESESRIRIGIGIGDLLPHVGHLLRLHWIGSNYGGDEEYLKVRSLTTGFSFFVFEIL